MKELASDSTEGTHAHEGGPFFALSPLVPDRSIFLTRVELWAYLANMNPPRGGEEHARSPVGSTWFLNSWLAHIIHERFCCNRGSAATTGLDAAGTASRPAGSPLGRSPDCWGLAPFFLAPVPVLRTGQAPPQTAEPVPWPPRACLARRLRNFAPNRHE